MDMNLLVALAILLMLAVIIGAVLARRRRSTGLAQRFGPEYERTVQRAGSRSQAEAELHAREQRVRKLEIVPLAAHEAQRFRMEWQGLQARFVDSPRMAVAEADLLVRDVMTRRGYPMGDFESRAADLSVDHPVVVENYRAAHEIALRERRGEADTEGLRQAFVHYRALFSELLEAPQARRARPEERPAERMRGGMLSPERAMAKEGAATRDRERRKER
ncbi:hypothetical protein H8N03_24705 [Ramlibacter sp. USB13]|uniref:Secreted protein n=1 Tax=Ramlibacter cellulosilyticus TaxID=2764187 RepID=A0A923SEC4_9BURK|nr:hypothetical protein [Ramlibacter cellulosilyticus]MBC5786163.1 hypothetical protein [Ramlibacter cellulosilyticus]